MAAACLRLVSFPPGLTDTTSAATRLSGSGTGSSGSGSVSTVKKECAASQVAFASIARLSNCSGSLTRGMTSWGPGRALLDGHGFQLDAKADAVEAGSFSNGVDWSKFGLWRWKLPVAAGASSAVLAGDDSVADEEVEEFATILDGKAIAAQIKTEVAAEVARMRDGIGKVPGLAVVLVGTRKDSETYVRSKKKACAEVGIKSYEKHMPEDVSEDEIVKVVEAFNADPDVHGVLVQLPLPQHVNEERVLRSVSEHKDVDGFNPLNLGRLAMQRREPMFVPCTPLGCVEILQRSGVQIAGKRAVVLGRSNIVGMPAALLLQRYNATVTIVHSQTPNPEEITRTADIVISAVGIPEFVRGHWLKPGAVVIDVGINPVDDPTQKRGYRLVGDVCFEEAKKVASAVTPVPGGVGPMTIAILLQNTLCSAKRAFGLPER